MNFIAHNRIDIEKTDIAAGLFHARFCEFYRLHVYTWQSPRGERKDTLTGTRGVFAFVVHASREHLKSHFTEWVFRNLPGSTPLRQNLRNVSLDLWALAAVKE